MFYEYDIRDQCIEFESSDKSFLSVTDSGKAK